MLCGREKRIDERKGMLLNEESSVIGGVLVLLNANNQLEFHNVLSVEFNN